MSSLWSSVVVEKGLFWLRVRWGGEEVCIINMGENGVGGRFLSGLELDERRCELCDRLGAGLYGMYSVTVARGPD